MESFNLEEQFKFYLDTVKLDPKNMSKIQLEETKRAFYAGVAQMWKMFIAIGELKEENCDHIFCDIEDQLAIFWIDETMIMEIRKKM